jgi:hypothetical protein
MDSRINPGGNQRMVSVPKIVKWLRLLSLSSIIRLLLVTMLLLIGIPDLISRSYFTGTLFTLAGISLLLSIALRSKK